MINTHITELTWFSARQYVPDSVREVVVLVRHIVHGTKATYHLTEGKYYLKQNRWVIDSKKYNPNRDLITQWAEKDLKRGAIAIPEPFPSEVPTLQPIANLK